MDQGRCISSVPDEASSGECGLGLPAKWACKYLTVELDLRIHWQATLANHRPLLSAVPAPVGVPQEIEQPRIHAPYRQAGPIGKKGRMQWTCSTAFSRLSSQLGEREVKSGLHMLVSWKHRERGMGVPIQCIVYKLATDSHTKQITDSHTQMGTNSK